MCQPFSELDVVVTCIIIIWDIPGIYSLWGTPHAYAHAHLLNIGGQLRRLYRNRESLNHTFLTCPLSVIMSRHGAPTETERPKGRSKGSNTCHPYRSNQPTRTRTQREGQLARTRQDGHYQPNETLFDRESVLDAIWSGRSGYDSDLENSDPSTSLSASFSSGSGTRNPLPSTSTPLHENRMSTQQGSVQREQRTRDGQRELHYHDIIAMLQEQQQLLQTLIRMQENMKESQSIFDQKLSALQEQVSTISSSCPTSSSEDKKCKVSRELTVSLQTLPTTLYLLIHHCTPLLY